MNFRARDLPSLPVILLAALLAFSCGEDPTAYLDAGDELLRQGRHEAAEEEYRRALEVAPSHPEVRLRLAGLHLLRDQTDAALDVLRPLAADERENPRVHLLLGQALARAGDLEAALDAFSAAQRLDEGWTAPRLESAAILLRAGRAEEAVAALEASERRLGSESGAEIFALWGRALVESGRLEEGEEKLEAALAQDAGSVQALHGLAALHLARDEPEEALEVLGRIPPPAAGAGAERARTLALLGRAHLASGQVAEAYDLLRRARSHLRTEDTGTLGRALGREVAAALEQARAALPQADAPAGSPDVLLVVLDSVRADHLGLYGYGRDTSPCLDALAAESVVFDNAVSQAPWTAPSVASLLTGLYPSVHGIDEGVRFIETETETENDLPFVVQKTLPPTHRTLAEVFRRHGYDTAGFVSNAFVHSVFGFADGFGVYHDERGEAAPRDARAGKIRGTETLERVVGWLDDGPGEPFFLFVHFNDAHWPYDPPPRFGADFVAGYDGPLDPADTGFLVQPGEASLERDLTPADVDYLVGLYDGEIRAVDHHVCTLLDHVRRRSAEGPLLTVVTSDHGEEFFDHGGTSHGYTLYEEQVHVPLLVHFPARLEPARVEPPVRLVDIFPTVVDLAGLEPPAGLQGQSLVPLLEGDPEAAPELLVSEATLGGAGKALRTGAGWKLIRDAEGRTRLFDLRSDPGEQRDLAERESEESRRLRRILDGVAAENEVLRSRSGPDEEHTVVVDEEMQERLRALGYIE